MEIRYTDTESRSHIQDNTGLGGRYNQNRYNEVQSEARRDGYGGLIIQTGIVL